MKILPIPPKEHLDECFMYDDGRLYWRKRPASHFRTARAAAVWNAKYAGKRAGRKMVGSAYRQIGLDSVRYLEHRLIAAMHGLDIEQCIDHRHGDGADNRIEFLRPASQQQNCWNNSGWAKKPLPVGVSRKPNGRFIACT